MTMKKTFLILLALTLIPTMVFAAAGSWGTPVPLIVADGGAFKTWSITFTASADNGTIPNYTTTATDQKFMKGYWLFYVETDPGSTGPTADYDIVINSASGYDIMGGALADRSATVTQRAFADLSNIKHSPPIDGALTVAVSNTTANSATCTIKFWLFK
jgi:hypothetical protein